jgi:hypothetical protein
MEAALSSSAAIFQKRGKRAFPWKIREARKWVSIRRIEVACLKKREKYLFLLQLAYLSFNQKLTRVRLDENVRILHFVKKLKKTPNEMKF